MTNPSRLLVSVIALAALLLFAGCGSKVTSENLDKIRNGMSQSEVKAILGNPDQVESGQTLGISGTTYLYKSGSSSIKVVFLNDAVMSKEGSFK